jgi:predicted short-subunit dehydrogenase-like oxidoreductase (DUF2520 family)
MGSGRGSTRLLRVVGAGRAGRSLAAALSATPDWELAGLLARGDDVTRAAHDVDLLVLAVPDDAIAPVARSVEPVPTTVVAHLAGSRGLDELAPHSRRAALHPLMTLPDEVRGAEALRGAWFAVAGDDIVGDVVRSLDGRSFAVADEQRALYHAAACVAANHLVALMGQVERLAGAAGVPFAAFFDIARAALRNTELLGPAAALTGPAARGDWDTIRRHLDAMPDDERAAYESLVEQARRLVA